MGEDRAGFVPVVALMPAQWCRNLAVMLLAATSLYTPFQAHALEAAEKVPSVEAERVPSHLPAFPLPDVAPASALPAHEGVTDVAAAVSAPAEAAAEVVPDAPSESGFWGHLVEIVSPAKGEAVAADVPSAEASSAVVATAEGGDSTAAEAAAEVVPDASSESGFWGRLVEVVSPAKGEAVATEAEASSAGVPADVAAPASEAASPEPMAVAAPLPAELPQPAPVKSLPAAVEVPVKPVGASVELPLKAERYHAGSALVAGQGADFMHSIAGADGVISLDVNRNGGPADIMEPIRIDEAVAFALRNNFEAQASKSKLKSAYWEKMAAYSQFVPTLDWKYSAGQETSMPSSYNDIYGNRVMNDKHVRRDATFSVRQPLIDLAMIAEILNSANKESLAEQEDRDAREGIAYDTVSVYLKLIQARIAVQLADQYRGYLDDLSKRMEARVAGGGATAGDFERIKGRATQAEAARIEAIGDYETNLAEFHRLTQVTPAQLEIPGVLAPQVPGDVTAALERALVDNAAYRASILKTEVAKSTRDSAYAKTAPKVSLEYSDTYIYNAGGAANGNPVDGVYPDQEDKRLMVVAHWALNGGLEVMEGVTGAEKLREARYRAQDAKSRIEQGLRTSYNAINAADQRIVVLQQGVDANTKVVTEFEDQYKNGSRSIFELLDAHEQLYASRLNLMRLAIAKAQASYQVRRQMGDLLTVLIEQPTM